MTTLNYLKRLGLHGGRLVWRVFAILVPVIGYSFVNGAKSALAVSGDQQKEDEEYGVYADGSPWYENASHPQWEAYYGKDGK